MVYQGYLNFLRIFWLRLPAIPNFLKFCRCLYNRTAGGILPAKTQSKKYFIVNQDYLKFLKIFQLRLPAVLNFLRFRRCLLKFLSSDLEKLFRGSWNCQIIFLNHQIKLLTDNGRISENSEQPANEARKFSKNSGNPNSL